MAENSNPYSYRSKTLLIRFGRETLAPQHNNGLSLPLSLRNEEYYLFQWCGVACVNIRPLRCRQSQSTLSRPNERTKISFRHPHFKSEVLYQFFARNDKLQRARHTVAVARTLDVYSPHSDAAAIRYNSAETGGRAAMTTKLAFWNRVAVPRRMHLHRSAVGCAKP